MSRLSLLNKCLLFELPSLHYLNTFFTQDSSRLIQPGSLFLSFLFSLFDTGEGTRQGNVLFCQATFFCRVHFPRESMCHGWIASFFSLYLCITFVLPFSQNSPHSFDLPIKKEGERMNRRSKLSSFSCVCASQKKEHACYSFLYILVRHGRRHTHREKK